MKYLLLPIFLTLLHRSYAQSHHADKWPLGYGADNPNPDYGGSLINFSAGPPTISFFNIQFAYSGDNANISDVHGNLVAYTNGCQVQNSTHQMMENGDNINPGLVHVQQCSEVSGYSNDQGAIFLPKPGSQDSLYYLFHLKANDFGSVAKQLLYTVIDARANNGLGKVLEKNIFLEEDTISSYVSAVRHANGRDWWLIIQKTFNFFNTPLPPNSTGKFHCYLFDPYGIHPLPEQQTGPFWTPQNWTGQACFSPDGTRYAIGNIYNGVTLFDFDRCSGRLSNPLQFHFSIDTTFAMGLAFSPNSRFLYITTGRLVLQVDSEAPDPEASKQIVAIYDGYTSILPTTFYHLMLAPDGKIYGSASNAANVLHIIHHPDSIGPGCQVEQHGLKMPTYHKYTLPNYPYYDLYDVSGSICDSLGISGPATTTWLPEQEGGISVFPNPTSGEIFWSGVENENLVLRISDAMGRLVLLEKSPSGRADLSRYPAGVYFLEFRTREGQALFVKAIYLEP